MEVNVKRQTMEAERVVGRGSVQLLLRAETLVSGAGREDVEILLADGSVNLNYVNTESGRLTLDGDVKCQCAYRLGGEMSARAVSAEQKLNHAFDIKGAERGMIARARAQVDEVKARYENGHMMFDVSVSLDAQALALMPVDVITGIDGDDSIEAKYMDVESMKLSAENSVTALLTDSVALPAALDARCALMEWAHVTDLDARKDLGGVRVTGNVLIETLISSGIAQRPAALIRYTMPLDQLVELPEWLSDNTFPSAHVRSVKTEVEQALGGEDGSLRMEAEIDVSVAAIGADRATALIDAYSTGTEALILETMEFDVLSGFQRLSLNEPFRGTLLLPDGAGAVGNVLAVRARAIVGDTERDAGRTNISGVVSAQVIYMSGSGDRLMHAEGDLPFEASVAAQIPDDAWIDVSVQSAEGNALMSDRVEIKCMLGISVDKCERGRIAAASFVRKEGENSVPRGILIIWPQEDESAWDIAKRYRAPQSAVFQNALSQEAVKTGKPIVMRR